MRSWISKAMALAFSAACGWVSAQAPADRLMATGSESMELLVQLLRDDYKAKSPGFAMDIRAEGSAAAPKALTEGTAHLGLMSREMKQEEIDAFQTKWGYAPTRIAVAMDALVVLVNKNNPIKEITIEHLDAVFSSTRLQGWPKDITLWGELGVSQSGWANRPIVRWGRPNNSGTRLFFREVVEAGGKGKEDTKRVQDALGLTEELTANQAAMGYGSMGEVFSSIKAVPIVPKGAKTGIAPTVENVASGAYPLARYLYIYVNKAPGKPLPATLQGFLAFTLSPEGQNLVKANGQVPLPSDLAQLNLRRVQN